MSLIAVISPQPRSDDPANRMQTTAIRIPAAVYDRVEAGMGAYFSRLNGADPKTLARDMLNTDRGARSLDILRRYTDPTNKRILEVGCGYGITLIDWRVRHGLDVTGIEPETSEFAETLSVSRQLCVENDVPPSAIISGTGENLPFADSYFDIVFSSNVIEHATSPVRVLHESLRVLRPGGLLHFEMPNFLSYFEGHYYVLMPPLLWRGLLPWWVSAVYGRDPGYARTLHTEINPPWLRRTVVRLGQDFPCELVSLGEEVFRDRLRQPFRFQQTAVGGVLNRTIALLQRMNVGNLLAHTIILLQGHYPIYLTVIKK